ncbi:MAG: hypothetical protein K2N05_11405 [Muribaculaceae bacterium]|nr:hypothetical protein [Muribaculaceae bacterium]
MFNFFRRKNIAPIPKQISRHQLRKLKWERIQRKKLRWGVIRLYIIQDELNNSHTAYDVKKHFADLRHTLGIIDDIDDFTLNENDFLIINRFLTYKHSLGLCDRNSIPIVTYDGYISIRNIDAEKYLIIAYNNYEAYWDDILSSYKRQSDKKKRLQSIIESLDSDSKEPITHFPDVRKKIHYLSSKYENILNQIQ